MVEMLFSNTKLKVQMFLLSTTAFTKPRLFFALKNKFNKVQLSR